MPEFDHTHYVPILKGKEGEYLALRELSAAVRQRMTPVIEPPSIPYDFANETPAKTVDEHLAKVVEKLDACWGRDLPLFIDLGWIPASEVMSDGRQPLKYIFDEARLKELMSIPVTGLSRESQYQDAVKEALDTDSRGICIRLENDDFVEFGDLEAGLSTLLSFFGVSPFEVDLIIDFEAISVGPVAMAANAAVANLPFVRDWRTLTLAATAFPQDLSNVPPRSATPLPRTEWINWQALAARRHRLLRLPTFGDYGIAHPLLAEIDPRVMQMSAQLRYTTETDWLVMKARNVKAHGYGQFNDICRYLVTRPEYKGADFSWGDSAISEATAAGAASGNATTWRRIGTNHHLTFVVDQIANLPGL